MPVASQDLVLFAGGECLEKYGTLVRKARRADGGDPTHACTDPRYYFDEFGVVRQAAANVPRPDFVDWDGSGDLRPLLALERDLVHRVGYNVPGGALSGFDLIELEDVTNLSNEYGIRSLDGSLLQTALPAPWNPNGFSVGVWTIPEFANTDGEARTLLHIVGDADN